MTDADLDTAAEIKVACLMELVEKIEAEIWAIGEPSESVQLGRLQVCDEVRAIIEREEVVT